MVVVVVVRGRGIEGVDSESKGKGGQGKEGEEGLKGGKKGSVDEMGWGLFHENPSIYIRTQRQEQDSRSQ